jgi:fructose-1,6-bisphosphatase/inositol monophosphatase family enzyme
MQQRTPPERFSMNSAELNELTSFALHAGRGRSAGEILPHFRENVPIDIKAAETWDPVTEGDRAGERAIRHLIEKHAIPPTASLARNSA